MSHAGLVMSIGPEQMKFSAGEIQVEYKNMALDSYWKKFSTCIIDARQHDNDIMAIAQSKDILDKNVSGKIQLKIPYMPYSRQDRRMASENCQGSHALKIFAKFINSLKFDSVITFDPHSDVCEAVFDNLKIVKNHGLVHDAIIDLELDEKNSELHFIVPDAGASKKIIPLCQSLSWNMKQNLHVHQCEKHRDPSTGEITHTSIPSSLANLPEKTKVCLIDDICDGGRSFIEIAKLAPLLNWNLVVSHGIFSKGLDPLFEHFDQIFTTNSFKQESHPNLIVLDF